jgi:hypothetical protein
MKIDDDYAELMIDQFQAIITEHLGAIDSAYLAAEEALTINYSQKLTPTGNGGIECETSISFEKAGKVKDKIKASKDGQMRLDDIKTEPPASKDMGNRMLPYYHPLHPFYMTFLRLGPKCLAGYGIQCTLRYPCYKCTGEQKPWVF